MSAARSIDLILHDLETDRESDTKLASILSDQEIERSRRFHCARHGRYFRSGRARLRQVLGLVLERDATRVDFFEGPNGKPWVEGAPPFNVSHCDRWLLIGLTTEGSIGVDVEQAREIDDLESIARHYFARAERDSILALDRSEANAAFLRVWTRKEAFIKALGGGLSIDLSAFVVDTGDHYENALAEVRLQGHCLSTWWVGSVFLEAALFASVAVDAAKPEVRTHRGFSAFAESTDRIGARRYAGLG